MCMYNITEVRDVLDKTNGGLETFIKEVINQETIKCFMYEDSCQHTLYILLSIHLYICYCKSITKYADRT